MRKTHFLIPLILAEFEGSSVCFLLSHNSVHFMFFNEYLKNKLEFSAKKHLIKLKFMGLISLKKRHRAKTRNLEK